MMILQSKAISYQFQIIYPLMGSLTTSTKPEIAHDIFPYLIEYKDGTIERRAGTQKVPPGFDLLTNVTSKDTLLVPETGLSARLYRPTATNAADEKLPLVVYFHGGAFVIASPAEPIYHGFCNALASSSNALVVSVDYRLAPEHPFPAAFDDAWAAIQWMAAHAAGAGPDSWLNEGVDFGKVFLVGDSAGATLAHHVASQDGFSGRVNIQGISLIHPYFWGKDPIGFEWVDQVRKTLVYEWWEYVCPSDKGCDDPLINPFVDEGRSLNRVACERMIVLVAEKDILRDRGRLYYEAMVKKKKKVEYFETLGEDHVFFLFKPHCQQAKDLVAKLANFIKCQ